ncbi:hypothetical protein ACEWY4_005094 [Coilia grayii]|uniref:Sushi domain-containing protein n=1 Tax=Coilia grayii TaxID=363190 RepID=A0ABD1KHQ5_9TELE
MSAVSEDALRSAEAAVVRQRRGRRGGCRRTVEKRIPGQDRAEKMSHGAMVRASAAYRGSPSAFAATLPLLLLLSLTHTAQTLVCPPPLVPENGGYTCHPSPCRVLSEGTVIEYFCDEGYVVKGDYRFLTCTDGEWDTLTQVRCLPAQEREPEPVLGVSTLSLVATTSSVLLILLLVVLFVLLQPRLKSFQHAPRYEEVGEQPVSIVVDGVQVTLPSYEEAVAGSSTAPPTGPPPPMEQPSEDPSAPRPSQQSPSPPPGPDHTQAQAQQAEMAEVHREPRPSSPASSLSSSPSLSSWGPVLGATADTHSEQDGLLLQPSQQDLSDDIPLLKEA